MRSWTITALIIVLIALVLGGLALFKHFAPAAPAPSVSNSTSTPSGTNSNLLTYNNSRGGFTFKYWSNFKLEEGGTATTTEWRFNNNDQTEGFKYVTVSLPEGFEPKTNFSEGKFQVGSSRASTAVANCLNPDYPGEQKSRENMNGVDYTVYRSMDAGAGNFYELTSYRALHGGQCYAAEILIHSTNIGNYPPEYGIKEFDHDKVFNALHAIFETFVLQ